MMIYEENSNKSAGNNNKQNQKDFRTQDHYAKPILFL